MKMSFLRGLLGGFLALAATLPPLSAQAGGRRPFAVLGPDQGLSSGSVLSLTQDREGFIWLGTENGLVRYDGGQCRYWTPEDGLPSAYIFRVLHDPEGGVWVSTLRGLVHFRHGHVQGVHLGAEGPWPASTLITLDGHGRLWAATQQGLFVQEGGTRFRAVPRLLHGDPASLTCGGTSGAVYLSTGEGIEAFLPDGTTRRWTARDGLPGGGHTLVAEDGAGGLWAGTGNRLLRLPPGGTRFVDESRRLPASLSPNGSTFRDPDGSVWFPTQGGALHLSGDRTEMLNAAVGLPFRWVRSIFRDREGTLWVLGPALARLRGGDRVRNYTLSHDPFGEVVWFIDHDRKGRLLVATDDGAARMGPDGLDRIPGTEGRRIKALAQDRGGTLWMVTTIGPTLWLRPGQTRVEVAPLGELGDQVNTVFEDREGRIWLGSTRHGVLRWDPAARRLVQEAGPALAGVQRLGAFQMTEDAQGRLWVGSSSGLLVRSPKGIWHHYSTRDGLRPHTVFGAALLPDGSAWLHYQEPEGLTRVRLAGDRLEVLEQLTRGHGLRSGLIYAVQVDNEGRTWMSTDRGLDRLDPPLHVGRDDGMASEDCAVLALLVEGGQVWVGTAGGLVRYDAEGPQVPLDPPQAHILRVFRNDRPLEPPFTGLGTLPAREATLAFHFAAPSFTNERAQRFQVRLLGLEDQWHETEGRGVRYPALPGGSYQFEVRAANGDGPFGPAEALAFTVRPPWWRTAWAVGLAGLGFLAVMFGAFRLRLASLARSKANLEIEVAQHTQELRARNEELSAALTRVKQLSGLLPICAHCKKIRDDHGYWNQLEQYISERSEADFSHGICPDCARELFPGHSVRKSDPKA